MGALRVEDLPSYSYDEYILWEDNWELIYGVAYTMSPAPMIKHHLNHFALRMKLLIRANQMAYSELQVLKCS